MLPRWLRRHWLRINLCCGVLAVAFPLLLIAGAAKRIDDAAEGLVYQQATDVPEHDVALVLGCAKYLSDGRRNLFFAYRIEAAITLYKAGKVRHLLVSGDNSSKTYDEPSQMKAALVQAGIPQTAITCDYAGFSTLDSVVRAREVFQLKSAVVVSQNFHCKRAIFIGKAHNITLIAYAARDVTGYGGLRTRLREALARVKAVADVSVLNRQPTFLGEPVPIS